MKALQSIFGWMRDHPVQAALVVVLASLLVVFLAILFSDDPTWAYRLVGPEEKFRILERVGVAMGGMLLAIGVAIAHQRAKAMEEAAKAQAEANKGAEDGRRQERLKNAIEHLGHDSDSVRLGGAYELFHLARDTEDLRQTVLDILCAHIRRTTGEKEYRSKCKSKPSEEVQSLLTLLFVKDHEIFKGCDIDLQGSWLNGANLSRARLKNAKMDRIYMRGATLDDAYLVGARLIAAELQGARFVSSYLPGAHMSDACLQGANLGVSHLRGVDFFGAHLEGANLNYAQMQGANLAFAFLQEAHIYSTNLQGVTSKNHMQQDFSDHIKGSIEQHSDLGGVIFGGGLTKEDIAKLVEILPDENAGILKKLELHIDVSPCHNLPKDSYAITGPYTKEAAKKWIEEYNNAIFGDDDRKHEDITVERPGADG